MVEEKKPEKKPEEESKEEPDKKPKEEKKEISTTPLIDVASAVADRIEKGNIRTAELLDRQEVIEAQRRLGGEAGAGEQEAKPKEETDEEYTEKFLKGEAKLSDDTE